MRGRVPIGRDITHYNAFVPGAQLARHEHMVSTWRSTSERPPHSREKHCNMALSNAPPNILLTVADDLGFSDLGAFGGERLTFSPISSRKYWRKW